MTQDQFILLLFKVVLTVQVVTSIAWVLVYTYLAQWQRNAIGKNITIVALGMAAWPVPSLLSLYFHFNRQTSRAAGWVDLAIFSVIAVTMLLRTPLWVRLHLDKDGQQSYEGMLTFLAQVIRRRGRPLWKDEVPQEPESEEA